MVYMFFLLGKDKRGDEGGGKRCLKRPTCRNTPPRLSKLDIAFSRQAGKQEYRPLRVSTNILNNFDFGFDFCW